MTISRITRVLAGITATAAVDVVGVYTQDFTQVFADARAIKVNPKPNSQAMKHPVEIGEEVTDHRILLPVELELTVIVQGFAFNSAYREIKQLFEDGTLLSVHTRVDVYENQFIVSMPHVEDSSMYDAVSIELKMQEFQTITPEFAVVPKRPTNTSTVDRGNQQGVTPSESKRSAAHETFAKYIKKK